MFSESDEVIRWIPDWKRAMGEPDVDFNFGLLKKVTT